MRSAGNTIPRVYEPVEYNIIMKLG